MCGEVIVSQLHLCTYVEQVVFCIFVFFVPSRHPTSGETRVYNVVIYHVDTKRKKMCFFPRKQIIRRRQSRPPQQYCVANNSTMKDGVFGAHADTITKKRKSNIRSLFCGSFVREIWMFAGFLRAATHSATPFLYNVVRKIRNLRPTARHTFYLNIYAAWYEFTV